MTTVLTLALDPDSQRYFETLRQRYYPPALNRIPAHLSLFHQLPADDETRAVLAKFAAAMAVFPAKVTGVRSLGRGVAYTVAAAELTKLHAELATRFEEHLIPQDRQRFQPHIVVQNKAMPGEAKALLAELGASFEPQTIQATGLLWWEYLGGPWRLIETFPFADHPGSGIS